MTSFRRPLAAAVLALAALAPGAALAQRSAADIESARQLYNQGIALRDKGDLAGALEKFKAAHALGDTPITGLALCKAHAALHHPVEAREVCLGVGRIPKLKQETSHSEQARQEAARIAEEEKPKIATIRVRITGVPAGREPTVTFDGASIPAAALGEPRAVDPGHHVIVARVGQGPETRATITTREGDTKSLALAVQVPPEAVASAPPASAPARATPAPPPPEEHKGNGLTTVGLVIAGVGVGLGTVTGLLAISGKSDLDDRCTDNICGREDHDALDSARTWGTLSTVSFVIAGGGLVLALVGALSPSGSSSAKASAKPPRPSVTPSIGLGGVGFHGAF